MPAVPVSIDATTGSSIGPDEDEDLHEHEDLPPVSPAARAHGWPVGHGQLLDTLHTDGFPLQALVLMQEPALSGAQVEVRPLGVLYLADGGQVQDAVLGVADVPALGAMVDSSDMKAWHATPGAWMSALGRLDRSHDCRLRGSGSQADAERLIARAHREYLRLTGCLE
ncbi:inorganic diphosphatase [Streptomyces sp. DW26H14]|uniref:inorganic diphosphatase n=1 Tax=Streptomyces sp. DW26H14 TaxID=3435395 RepID=UPI00403E2CA2